MGTLCGGFDHLQLPIKSVHSLDRTSDIERYLACDRQFSKVVRDYRLYTVSSRLSKVRAELQMLPDLLNLDKIAPLELIAGITWVQLRISPLDFSCRQSSQVRPFQLFRCLVVRDHVLRAHPGLTESRSDRPLIRLEIPDYFVCIVWQEEQIGWDGTGCKWCSEGCKVR